uniref:MULE transposase domain-containing protein n=1 Tax=Tanacetum cinerariifolium TaxID=118510 RepID=A0A699H2L1_TANCI|nr:hypothetical protein CTI12_AA105810 [Tanacetum cinerariifolium]
MVKMVPYEAFACPCGAGDVVLRESYKPKTRGKLYYACPRSKPLEDTFGSNFFMERGTSPSTGWFSWNFNDSNLFSRIFIDSNLFSRIVNTSTLFSKCFNNSKLFSGNFKKCRDGVFIPNPLKYMKGGFKVVNDIQFEDMRIGDLFQVVTRINENIDEPDDVGEEYYEEPKNIDFHVEGEQDVVFEKLTMDDPFLTKLVDHRCTRSYNMGSLVTFRWIARHYARDIILNSGISYKFMREDIREKYMVDVSLGQCKRAKQCALYEHDGGLIEHYGKPWEYRQSNPGSTCHIDVDVQDNGQNRFHRLYMYFKVVKDGWLSGCRKVIGIDGCFLTHVCKGELLTAMARDANNQMYLIAWAIVDVENTNNWCWFLSLLADDLQLEEGLGLTIISDSHKENQIIKYKDVMHEVMKKVMEEEERLHAEKEQRLDSEREHNERIFQVCLNQASGNSEHPISQPAPTLLETITEESHTPRAPRPRPHIMPRGKSEWIAKKRKFNYPADGTGKTPDKPFSLYL